MVEKARFSEGFLFTDLYQLTMAQLYWQTGIAEKSVQFDYFFRSYPDYGSHKSGFCIFAGTGSLVEWLKDTRCRIEDIENLKKIKSRSGERLFGDGFVDWLVRNGNFNSINIKAVEEGRVVHPTEPVAIIEGQLAIAQILESAFLNIMNYQTLVATKAARIKEAGGNTVLEFGLRRAQGRGANQGTRAGLIGGADFSSNTAASLQLGIAPKGTHAHSMVQAFIANGANELEAFNAYAETYPDDCLLLVDTINTLESGVPNAIRVFERLKSKGHKPVGIRLDSGDLAYLSIKAAKMLDDAGFEDTIIVLSNQLDEMVIWQILTQIKEDAPAYGVESDKLIKRICYGVGTSLITSAGASALDGVYKLSSVKENGKWAESMKISQTASKTTNPGFKNVWRIYDKRGKANADVITLSGEKPDSRDSLKLYHPVETEKYRIVKKQDISTMEMLLKDVLRDGKLCSGPDSVEKIRETRKKDIEKLDSGVKRLVNPHIYHVSLSEKLWQLKQKTLERNNNSV
jgi:nicotinate phosphoribosyltransferase